jgi:hypothetical protein
MTISGLTRQKLARALGSQSDASSICDLLDSGEVGTARDSAIRRLSYALGSQSAATAVEASLESATDVTSDVLRRMAVVLGSSFAATELYSAMNAMSAEPPEPPVATTDASVSGFSTSQLAGDSILDASTGRMFLNDGLPIWIAGTLSAIKVRLGSATSCRVSIWRAGTRVWQSDLFSGLTANAVNTLTVSIAVQPDDQIGVWVPSGTIATRAFGGCSIKYGADATGDITSSASLGTTSATNSLCVEAIAVKPMLAVVGDSIVEGHNTGTNWHGPFHGVTQGTNQLAQPGYIAAKAANWGYQNHSLGSTTFDWAAATGFPSAVASGATHIWVHSGVNDVAGGRTWAAIEANLDTILASKPDGVTLYISEILPWTNGTDANGTTIRTFNANLETWCNTNEVELIRCHDVMGQQRGTNGQLDDLNDAYDSDGVHLTTAGVTKFASCFPGTAPSIQSTPWISGGLVVGKSLIAVPGDVYGTQPITSAYQWKADGSNISGATSQSYTLTSNESGKAITVAYSATNSSGSDSDTSVSAGTVGTASAVDFDGTDDYADQTVTNFASNGSFSVEMLLDADASTAADIFAVDGNQLIIAFSSGYIVFGRQSGWARWTYGNGRWRFVHDMTQTSGFGRLRAWKDGVEQTQFDTVAAYGSFAFTSRAATIGKSIFFGWYNGRISELRAWDRKVLPSDSDQATGLVLSLGTVSGSTWDDQSINDKNFTLYGGASGV